MATIAGNTLIIGGNSSAVVMTVTSLDTLLLSGNVASSPDTRAALTVTTIGQIYWSPRTSGESGKQVWR